MHNVTPLSAGHLNGQTLKIELVESGNDLPNTVAIRWPDKPTLCPPSQLDATVAAAMRILANSVVELAALRLWKKL
jgi:hypothetical protein